MFLAYLLRGGNRHLLYQDVVGALCATDYKWVQREQVDQGKLIIEVRDDGEPHQGFDSGASSKR